MREIKFFKKFNKKSVAFSWFVSYILIIVVATFINMYTYYIAKEKVLSQINAINQESLERTRVQLDNLQKNIGDMATEFTRDENVRKLMARNEADSDFLYDVISLKEKITAWENLENDVERVFIYFKNTDYIADRSIAKKSEFYHKLYYGNKSISAEEFKEALSNGKNGTYLTVADREKKETEANVIFLYSIYSEDLFEPQATIAVEIKNETLIAGKNGNSYFGNICILDGENNILLSSVENESKLQKTINEEMKLAEKKEIYISGEEVILYTQSVQNNWKYLTVIEKGQYLKELHKIRLLTYMLIGLYIIIGVALAAFMTIKNRKPILQIVEQLSNYKKEVSNRGDGNEFQYINHCIVDLLKKREEQNRKMVLQRPVIKDAVLNELLQNETIPEVSLKELLSSADISLWEKYFLVVIFHFDASGLFFETEKDDKENRKLSHLILSNIMGEMIDDSITPVFCKIKDDFVCIMNSSCYDMEKGVKEALCETISFVRSNFNLKIVAGMSLVHEDYYGLRTCYSEALECMEYKFFVDYDIIEYNTIRESFTGMYYFPIEKEIQMIKSLKSGDYETGLNILNQIFDENMKQTKPQIHTVKCLVYDIMGVVMKVLNDLGEVDGENIFKHFKVFERIDNCKSVTETKTAFIELFREICEKAIAKSIEKASNSIEVIKEFVDNRYHDPNLSGAMVAAHFNINQSYLSALFKKYTGEGLLEYTMKVRMEKAMRLLADTDETVESISEKVGYLSVKTFRRTFKKIYGFTPSMYREAVKQK